MNPIDKDFYFKLGKKIKQARNDKKLSLQDLADKINILIEIDKKNNINLDVKPVIRQSLNKMELGKLRIDKNIYDYMCQVLDLNPNDNFNYHTSPDKWEKDDSDGIYIQKADGTSVFLKNASGADKALIELPEDQKKAILTMIGKTMDEIDKELDGE